MRGKSPRFSFFFLKAVFVFVPRSASNDVGYSDRDLVLEGCNHFVTFIYQ